MAQSKKRPQYIKDIVESVNFDLRYRKVKDEDNDLFRWICYYLLKRGYYRGFNYFKDYDNKYLGKVVPTEAGSYDPDKFDYLQVY